MYNFFMYDFFVSILIFVSVNYFVFLCEARKRICAVSKLNLLLLLSSTSNIVCGVV